MLWILIAVGCLVGLGIAMAVVGLALPRSSTLGSPRGLGYYRA